MLRDIKRLQKKHVDTSVLRPVIKLILENTVESREELIRRHDMHTLGGAWDGSNECPCLQCRRLAARVGGSR